MSNKLTYPPPLSERHFLGNTICAIEILIEFNKPRLACIRINRGIVIGQVVVVSCVVSQQLCELGISLSSWFWRTRISVKGKITCFKLRSSIY